jgi:putative FmdB family regulatory protein
MALYEFQCDSCGHRLEVLQKHSDPPPVCGPCDEALPDETPYMTRQVSVSSFQLAGDGWARDNYGLKRDG